VTFLLRLVFHQRSWAKNLLRFGEFSQLGNEILHPYHHEVKSSLWNKSENLHFYPFSSVIKLSDINFTCIFIHLSYIFHVITIHLNYIYHTFDNHLTYIWHTFATHSTYIWHMFGTHSPTFVIRLPYIWFAFDLHLTCIRLAFDMHFQLSIVKPNPK